MTAMYHLPESRSSIAGYKGTKPYIPQGMKCKAAVPLLKACRAYDVIQMQVYLWVQVWVMLVERETSSTLWVLFIHEQLTLHSLLSYHLRVWVLKRSFAVQESKNDCPWIHKYITFILFLDILYIAPEFAFFKSLRNGYNNLFNIFVKLVVLFCSSWPVYYKLKVA